MKKVSCSFKNGLFLVLVALLLSSCSAANMTASMASQREALDGVWKGGIFFDKTQDLGVKVKMTISKGYVFLETDGYPEFNIKKTPGVSFAKAYKLNASGEILSFQYGRRDYDITFRLKGSDDMEGIVGDADFDIWKLHRVKQDDITLN